MSALAQITDASVPTSYGDDRLSHAVARLAEEASSLGLHLVDIAGTIQDTAAHSSEQAALLTRATASAQSIAGANR